jgi:hypothetical protein
MPLGEGREKRRGAGALTFKLLLTWTKKNENRQTRKTPGKNRHPPKVGAAAPAASLGAEGLGLAAQADGVEDEGGDDVGVHVGGRTAAGGWGGVRGSCLSFELRMGGFGGRLATKGAFRARARRAGSCRGEARYQGRRRPLCVGGEGALGRTE